MIINKRVLNIVASFVIMMCIGGVYTWSVFTKETSNAYGASNVDLVYPQYFSAMQLPTV